MPIPSWFENLRGIRIFGLMADGVTPKELAVPDYSGDPAIKVILSNLAATLGLYTPARDILLDWFFGADDDTAQGEETLTAGSFTEGNWLERSEYLSGNLNCVLINKHASPNLNYRFYASRNISGTDAYEIIASTVTTNAITPIDLSSIPYDLFIRLDVQPNTNDQNLKSYLAARGN